MPKSKTRKNVDENFKVAAVQRLQTGGVPANDLGKELGVSIWSLRRWSRQYRKRTAAGAGAACEPTATPEELPAKPSSEPPVAPPVGEDGLRSHGLNWRYRRWTSNGRRSKRRSRS